jgi:hypothetical protein
MIHGRKLWTKQEVILTMVSPSSAGMTIMDVWRSKGLRPSLALRLSSLLIFRHWNPQLIGGICQYIYIYVYIYIPTCIYIYIYTYLHNYILIIYKEMHSTQLGSLESLSKTMLFSCWSLGAFLIGMGHNFFGTSRENRGTITQRLHFISFRASKLCPHLDRTCVEGVLFWITRSFLKIV